jgi:hypothetical protein
MIGSGVGVLIGLGVWVGRTGVEVGGGDVGLAGSNVFVAINSGVSVLAGTVTVIAVHAGKVSRNKQVIIYANRWRIIYLFSFNRLAGRVF